MSSLSRSLLVTVFALGLSGPALAQQKNDASSGPTNGAVSPNDAGSGPTKGVRPDNSSTASNSNGSTENSAGVTPGPKSTGGSQPVTPAMPEKQ